MLSRYNCSFRSFVIPETDLGRADRTNANPRQSILEKPSLDVAQQTRPLEQYLPRRSFRKESNEPKNPEIRKARCPSGAGGPSIKVSIS
jgi:hypothetical protein